MRLTRILLTVAVPAVVSCTQDATMQIRVASGENMVRWPPGQDSMKVHVRSRLEDPRGLAGVELRIAGDLPTRIFTATDFLTSRDSLFSGLFVVPDAGKGVMSVRLLQDGAVVAEGTREWSLDSGVLWDIHIARGPWAPSEGLGGHKDLENPPCFWFWCHRNWRFPIVAEAANYQNEAVWVTLYRVEYGGCQDVC